MRRFRVRDAGLGRPPHTWRRRTRVRRQTVGERREPVGPQRVMCLRQVTRLRRLGAAGSEQSMARTLTDAITRPFDAPRQGATRQAPRCSVKRPVLKSRRTRKRLFGLGVPALGGAHRRGCHDDQTADRGESRCLWLPQVPWSGLGFPAATLCTDPAIGRFFPLPCGRSGRKRSPRGLWPIVESGDRSPQQMI